jgi:hypothetical protein
VGKMKVQSFNSTISVPPDNGFTSLIRTMKSEQEEENRILENLIDLIKSEYKIHCKHPKKMHDTDPSGTVYCMKCGEDV